MYKLHLKRDGLPGVGRILGLTITMEVGEIGRFKTDGDFASYCRLVDARYLSNGKQKAENNAKGGNIYLAWAFVEAAALPAVFIIAALVKWKLYRRFDRRIIRAFQMPSVSPSWRQHVLGQAD